jgi:polyphosphate kinase
MAASATTTSREVGTVVGVAALGSLFNAQLTTYLTQRLIQLGVPEQFRSVVINAVETGQVPAGSAGSSGAEQQYGPIVAKVITAAYDAVHSGVSISLIVAGCVILASGLVAWFTFSPERLSVD